MNVLTKTAIGLLEKATSKRGSVLGLRHWKYGNIIEIDLHLPEVDMTKWIAVPYIKVKVAEATYRDYTPTMWDSETNTCTLMIDAAHNGPGSKWVNQLNIGDSLIYLGISNTSHKPSASGNAFCVGDASAMAHFFAMEQLAMDRVGMAGMILLNSPDAVTEFKENFRTSLVPVLACDLPILQDEIRSYNLHHQMVYVAGNIPLMTRLRKYIKHLESFEGIVKLQGFWS